MRSPSVESNGIDVKGFDYVATGYALKALGAVGVLQAPPVRRVDHLLARLNERVTEIASARPDLLPKDWQGQPVVTIDPHRIRHLVIGSYFASLTTHTFLRGPYYGSREPGLQGGGLGGYFDASSHPPGKLLNDVLERARRWLLILGRKQGKQPETLGAVWLNQARTLSAVETGEFEFVTSLLPPCFDRKTAETLREGMRARTLNVYDREVHVAGKLIYRSQLPQRTRYRSTW